MIRSPDSFAIPPKKSKFIRAVIAAPCLVLVAAVGVMQTSFFGSLFLTGPDRKAIRDHMQASKKLQEECLAEYKQREKRDVPDGIHVEMFEPDKGRRLNAIIDRMLKDDVLQSELKEEFGANFREIKVIVIPSWVIDGPENVVDLLNAGITPDGWRQLKNARRSAFVDGYTLRERPDGPRVTIDGRPRLVLNSSAFTFEDTLQLTVFHELLHCLNIEGSKPPAYCFAQDDLRYLKKYRDEVFKRRWNVVREVWIWGIAVFLPLAMAFSQIRFANGYLRSRREPPSVAP